MKWHGEIKDKLKRDLIIDRVLFIMKWKNVIVMYVSRIHTTIKHCYIAHTRTRETTKGLNFKIYVSISLRSLGDRALTVSD